MKLWQFTFTDPDFDVALIEVAAPTSVDAQSVIAEQLGILVDLSPAARKSKKRVIVAAAGENKTIQEPAVRRFVPRAGKSVAIITGQLKPGGIITEQVL